MTEPANEPDFEGEEMKMPTADTSSSDLTVKTKTVLNPTIIVILGIALLAIFAGLAYWYQIVMSTTNLNTSPAVTEIKTAPEQDQSDTPMATSTQNDTNPSDILELIEADINNTDLNNLDKELEAIDVELETSLSI